ncbi:hypothetical protein MSAS_30490 [Mycobacterium saskatchewanense]|uniref:UsfY protein n=1 Tax=Mycobacterium saskatchewanense TaxID=220927 RepID=A0AAJ3TVH3_9MYCO|nr:hypothetical protein [Mycobacterium saskatchewanense]ORW72269.1 hypothetical protein AWC23_10155 [Mycobacterium saskatchewanense]BBX63875.1 hypothetical protein MSAS_30490 [Mycobacterium saskatchewanense]
MQAVEVSLARDTQVGGGRHETAKNGPHAPGVYGILFAAAALVIALSAFATGHLVAGTVSVVLAAALGVASALWLVHSHRKVRAAEERWYAEKSDEPAPPPVS